MGTVSLVAERLQRRDLPAASVALASSLFLAAVGGAAMGAVYLVAGPALLRCTGADAAVLAYASSYLRIRALALPAVVVGQASPSKPGMSAGLFEAHVCGAVLPGLRAAGGQCCFLELRDRDRGGG